MKISQNRNILLVRACVYQTNHMQTNKFIRRNRYHLTIDYDVCPFR